MIDLSKLYCDLSVDAKFKHSVGEFSIFTQSDFKIEDFNFKVYVIGESHFIESRDMGYQEVVAGRELKSHIVVFDLKSPIFSKSFFRLKSREYNIKFDIDIIHYEKEVIDKFLKSSFIYHKFSNDAVTAIALVKNKNGFDTIHGYPEFNSIVLTKTRFNHYAH